jgi:hypothetical protein
MRGPATRGFVAAACSLVAVMGALVVLALVTSRAPRPTSPAEQPATA